MSEDEILKDIDNYISFANKAENFSDINEYLYCKELARRMKGLLDLYQQKCKQNKDTKDYIEYYLLYNMSIEGNAENTHKELIKLYNMLGGDNLR